jgi:regulator of protease activity HflC (stomatin/prohibitin superfamily)
MYVNVPVALSVNRKDVRLPVQLQRAMAAEAEAAREARAKVSVAINFNTHTHTLTTACAQLRHSNARAVQQGVSRLVSDPSLFKRFHLIGADFGFRL